MKKIWLLLFFNLGFASAATPLVVINEVAGNAGWVGQAQNNAGCNYVVQQIQGTTYPTDKSAHFKYINTFTFEADGSKSQSRLELELAVNQMDSTKFTTAWFENRGIIARMFYTSNTPNYVYYVAILNQVDDAGVIGSIVCVNVLGLRS